jgi:hypothetical protein
VATLEQSLDAHQLAHAHPSGSSADIIAGQILPFAPELPADFFQLIVDTTVQPKAVAFPTDAKLMHRARERLVRLAKKTGVELRQSYERVGKHALIAHQRYARSEPGRIAFAILWPNSSSAPTGR